MSISKIKLKKQLEKIGIKAQGNYVKKADLAKAVSEGEHPKVKALRDAITNLKPDDVDDMTAPDFVVLLKELYDFLYKEIGFELEGLILDDV